MSTFWQRNKRRLAALLAATTAGGVAAYYTYQLWYKDIEDNRSNITISNNDGDNDQSSVAGPSTSPVPNENTNPSQTDPSAIPPLFNNTTNPSSSSPSTDIAQRDAEAHLTNHFESILAIANTTTLPPLLRRLSEKIETLIDIDGRLNRLKSGELGSEEKIQLWKELSAASLTLLAASIWALPLLDLQVRCQLSILGRRLYLESALLGSHNQGQGGGGRAMSDHAAAMMMAAATSTSPITLTPATQESFLACAEHLKLHGLESLVSEVHKQARIALENISLDSPIDIQGMRTIVSTTLSAIRPPASPGAPGGWAPLLLPSAEELRNVLKTKHQQPDDRAALYGADVFLIDRDAVENMVGETWRVVSSGEFDEMVTKCSKHVAKQVMDMLEQQLTSSSSGGGGGSSRPLAKIVPLWVAVGREVVLPEGKVVESIREVGDVRTFMAGVYASPLM